MCLCTRVRLSACVRICLGVKAIFVHVCVSTHGSVGVSMSVSVHGWSWGLDNRRVT